MRHRVDVSSENLRIIEGLSLVYTKMPWGKDEEVWIAYPSNGIDHVGATRTIIISKKTGEILADVMLGE